MMREEDQEIEKALAAKKIEALVRSYSIHASENADEFHGYGRI